MTQSSAALAAEGGAADAPPSAEVVPLSDRVLLTRHLRGDREAFAELVRAYAHSVYGYLARCGVRAPERDDLFQEVFVKVHRSLAKGLPDGPVRPWLFAITVNTARDAFRRAKVRSVVTLEERAGDDVADELREDRPDRAAEARETASFLEREVMKLPLDQREVLVLVSIEGMSLAEAADAVGAPLDTAKTRLRRARLALAEAMKRQSMIAAREGSR
jgi:RNA polymerase sigma-70 factor (ECF subfamily)